MKNERKTESIVRDTLRSLGYFELEHLQIEEQCSDNPRIQKLLKAASKAGSGVGKPEFIIRASCKIPSSGIGFGCAVDFAGFGRQEIAAPSIGGRGK
ncbi:MAG: hypothetical protein ACYDBH_22225, partial [Acidobacteriaceae bacterium]